MCIVAYVSGHGFGHSAREVEILRRLPPDIPLVVKTGAPEWFWRSEVTRPFTFVADTFDVGTVQTTSVDVDARATLAAYQEMTARNAARADDEMADMERRGAHLIVTDVPSFPLTLAARLGVPGVCIANFTWADIYAELGEGAEPGLALIAERLANEYAQAALLLDAGLSLPMPYFPQRVNVGIVARPHRDRRNELVRLLGLDDHKRIALLYVGDWGLPLRWPLLETFASGWHFISLIPPPDPVANLTVLPQTALPHPDLVASCDLVVSKPGYGLVGECLSSGTPLLYCPRTGFAEYAALDAALSSWPGGLRVDATDFLALNWRDALDQLPPRGSLPKITADGGPRAAALLTQFYREGKLPANFAETPVLP